MTGIMKDTQPGEFLVGFPAYPKREWTRLHLSLRKVPELLAAQREP
jgi:UDP-3-O-[3-hydroxymyristoyl] glucosamine N-acyltransferase